MMISYGTEDIVIWLRRRSKLLECGYRSTGTVDASELAQFRSEDRLQLFGSELKRRFTSPNRTRK
jgi:hypothetical protein